MGAIEFAPKDVEHIGGRRIGALRAETVHHEIDRIVADPFDRQFYNARWLAIVEDFIG